MSRALFVISLSLLLSAPSLSSFAATATTVHVELNDPTGNPALSQMVIAIDKAKIKPGKVTFDVKNLSKTDVHEMIVVAVAHPDEKLPYDEASDSVVESQVKDLGEASDIPAGKQKSLTLTLKAGHYMLICNQPRHFHKGMKTNLLVVN